MSMAELLDKMGITDTYLNKKLQEGLDATSGTGDKKRPNYYVVAKYMDMVLRLKARYPIDETRFKIPGLSGITSVKLHEIVYSKDGKKKLKEKIQITKNEEAPF